MRVIMLLRGASFGGRLGWGLFPGPAARAAGFAAFLPGAMPHLAAMAMAHAAVLFPVGRLDGRISGGRTPVLESVICSQTLDGCRNSQ